MSPCPPATQGRAGGGSELNPGVQAAQAPESQLPSVASRGQEEEVVLHLNLTLSPSGLLIFS